MASSGAIGVGGAGTLIIGGVPYDWEKTIISQYAYKPKLVGMVAGFAEAISPQDDLDAFYDKLWNIQTAEGYGLDVWGRIVVIERTLQLVTRYFGFDEGSPDYDPFNVSPFYKGAGTTSSYRLSDDAYRVLILAKALANISYGSIPGLNAVLQLLFPGRGPCYVADNQDMTLTYKFGFNPTPVELAIIESSNVLPRLAGVKTLFDVGA